MSDAVTRLQALRRGKQARKRADALRSNRIRDRYAYQSYLGSHEQMNAQNLLGWDGLEILYNFLPTLRSYFNKHQGVRFHVAALSLFTKQISGNQFGDFTDAETAMWAETSNIAG